MVEIKEKEIETPVQKNKKPNLIKVFFEKIFTAKFWTWKKIIIFALSIIVICGGIYASNRHKAYKANLLTDDEKIVARIIKDYQSNLKNPSSMQIFEIRYYEEDKMILIDNSGQNGFGGMTRDIILYKDTGEYIGDDSDADKTITTYTDDDDRMKIIIGQGIDAKWTINNNYIKINVNKIMKNLDQVN